MVDTDYGARLESALAADALREAERLYFLAANAALQAQAYADERLLELLKVRDRVREAAS